MPSRRNFLLPFVLVSLAVRTLRWSGAIGSLSSFISCCLLSSASPVPCASPPCVHSGQRGPRTPKMAWKRRWSGAPTGECARWGRPRRSKRSRNPAAACCTRKIRLLVAPHELSARAQDEYSEDEEDREPHPYRLPSNAHLLPRGCCPKSSSHPWLNCQHCGANKQDVWNRAYMWNVFLYWKFRSILDVDCPKQYCWNVLIELYKNLICELVLIRYASRALKDNQINDINSIFFQTCS